MTKEEINRWYEIYPGSMGACAVAIALFGIDAVDPGLWGMPVYVAATDEEVEAARSLLAEVGLSIGRGAFHD